MIAILFPMRLKDFKFLKENEFVKRITPEEFDRLEEHIKMMEQDAREYWSEF